MECPGIDTQRCVTPRVGVRPGMPWPGRADADAGQTLDTRRMHRCSSISPLSDLAARTARSRLSRPAPHRFGGQTVTPTQRSPASARISVVRIRTAVVLAAPLGPSSEKIVPAANFQIDSVQHDLFAVGLAQACHPQSRATKVKGPSSRVRFQLPSHEQSVAG